VANYTDVLQDIAMNLDSKQKLLILRVQSFFSSILLIWMLTLSCWTVFANIVAFWWLTGEAGVGKTSLLRKLVNESPTKIKFVYCYTSHLDFDNLLVFIGDRLG